MHSLSFIWEVLAYPHKHLLAYLQTSCPPKQLLWTMVLPCAAIRSAAIFLRALWLKTWWPGLILAMGNFALQLLTWRMMVGVLPWLAKPYGVRLTHPQAMNLAVVLCAPMWLGGLLYALPEEPIAWLLVSRMGVLAAALYGLFLLEQSLKSFDGVATQAKLPMAISTAGVYGLVYGACFAFFGVITNVIFFMWGI